MIVILTIIYCIIVEHVSNTSYTGLSYMMFRPVKHGFTQWRAPATEFEGEKEGGDIFQGGAKVKMLAKRGAKCAPF